MASPLSPNTCCPSCISSWGSLSFVRPRCQLTNCEGQPSLRELRGAFPPSWQLKLFYCICSRWLQATLPGLVPIAFRHLLLCLIKEPAGVCCHASSLYTRTLASLCLLRFKVLQSPFRCSSPCLFKYACRWRFLCPIRKQIKVVGSEFTKNTSSVQVSSLWDFLGPWMPHFLLLVPQAWTVYTSGCSGSHKADALFTPTLNTLIYDSLSHTRVNYGKL